MSDRDDWRRDGTTRCVNCRRIEAGCGLMFVRVSWIAVPACRRCVTRALEQLRRDRAAAEQSA